MMNADLLDLVLTALHREGITTRGVEAARTHLKASPWPRDFTFSGGDPMDSVAAAMVRTLAQDVVDRKVKLEDFSRRVLATEATRTSTWREVEQTVHLYWKRKGAELLAADAPAVDRAIEKATAQAVKERSTAAAALEQSGVTSHQHAVQLGSRTLGLWEANDKAAQRLRALHVLRRQCVEAGLLAPGVRGPRPARRRLSPSDAGRPAGPEPAGRLVALPGPLSPEPRDPRLVGRGTLSLSTVRTVI